MIQGNDAGAASQIPIPATVDDHAEPAHLLADRHRLETTPSRDLNTRPIAGDMATRRDAPNPGGLRGRQRQNRRSVSTGTLCRIAGLGLLLWAAAASAPAQANCAVPPPPVRDIDLPRFYSDDSGSIVDPALLAKHRAAVAPLTTFLRAVVSDADKSIRRIKPDSQAEAGICAVLWLDAWARGEAWLGNMASKQGEYQRKWDLGGVALAYLKVRRFASEDERRRIEPWLVRWADVARAFFDHPERKRNNHWYWLGVGLAATALATDSGRHWDLARGIMMDAAKDIQANGTLALELERKGRALHYHVFAATPLVMLAELGFVNGEDWYKLGDGALHRLVAAAARSLANPEAFAQLAGEEQESGTTTGAGWLILYERRYRERVEADWPTVKPAHRWLGGDVLLLTKVLGALPPPAFQPTLPAAVLPAPMPAPMTAPIPPPIPTQVAPHHPSGDPRKVILRAP